MPAANGDSRGGGGGIALAVGSNFISALHHRPFTLILRRVKPTSFPNDSDDESGSDDDKDVSRAEESLKGPGIAAEAKHAKKMAKAAVMAANRMIPATAMGDAEGASVVYGAAAAALLPDATYDVAFLAGGVPSTSEETPLPPENDTTRNPSTGIGVLVDEAQAADAAKSLHGAVPIDVDARAVMAVDGASVTQGGGRSVFGGPAAEAAVKMPKKGGGGATKRAKSEAAAGSAVASSSLPQGHSGGVALPVRVRTAHSAFVGGIVGCMEIGQPQLRALIVSESLALLRPSPATAPTLKEALVRALPDDMFVLLHPVARLSPPFLATLHHGSFCALPNSPSNDPDDEARCMVSLVPNPLLRFCLPLDSAASVDVTRVFEGDKRLSRLARRSGGDAYKVTCNVEPRRCLLAVRDYHIKVHEKTWLLMPLIESLVTLADKAREAVAAGKDLPSKVCVFALWGPSSAAAASSTSSTPPPALLAVTVGLWAGRAYHDVTMATLVRDKRSLGHCLSLKQAALLRRAGCDLWYWGVELGYMSTYRAHGAKTLDRMSFLALWDSLAAKPRDAAERAVEGALVLPAGIGLAAPAPVPTAAASDA